MVASPLAVVSRLRVGVGLQVRVRGRDVSVWLLADGSISVLDNACLHVGGPIADGAVADGCVVCPWHGWTYDLVTGERQTVDGPVAGLRTYRAWIEGDTAWADVPGA